MREILAHLLELSRFQKRLIMLLVDTVIITACVWIPHVLLQGLVAQRLSDTVPILLFVMPVSLIVFVKLGLYRAIVRYVEDQALIAVLKGCFGSTLIYIVSHLVLYHQIEPIIPILYCSLLMIFVGGSRFMVRIYVQSISKKARKKVIIYGAGDSGIQLNKAFMIGKEYEAVVFLEDRRSLYGTRLAGLEVAPLAELPSIIAKTGATQIFLAMPSITKVRLKEVLESLQCYPLHVRIIPSLSDLVNGKARIEEVRDVEVEDLLGRDPVDPNPGLMQKCILNRVVLVTGAGGSIGSELCRQIANQRPTVLLMLDNCEYALYRIEREISAKYLTKNSSNQPPIILKALLGSVCDTQRMAHIIKAFKVETIYHAAAFKHVPMVEHNIVDGVKNNSLGTYNLAKIAQENKVDTFVLVSTDKAVRPTNVMGASKRLAELILQGLALQSKRKKDGTNFCMVRFGNVLESSGSVVPLFRAQIAKGGPVTITHPEIIRYFMTIPEAAQLVIQASSLSKGGDVFVLDMGEPVKIADLARKLIRLMGREVQSDQKPEGDIELEYTGLRPGEKLFEELLIGDNVLGTEHPRIMRAEEDFLPWSEIERILASLTEKLEQFDCVAVRELLLNCEAGYRPNHEICDLVWLEQSLQEAKTLEGGAKVYNIDSAESVTVRKV